MTDPSIALIEHLRNLGTDLGDFLRESIRLMSRMLMELEVKERTGAGKYERTSQRKNRRNSYRERTYASRRNPVAHPEPLLVTEPVPLRLAPVR